MKQSQTPLETVVIRFTRQIYYEDRPVYQIEVRESPTLLRSGPFETDIEERLVAFRALFAARILAEHDYEETPADLDPDIELATQELASLGTQLYELLPLALREGLPRLLQHVFDRGRGVRLVFEAKAGDQADLLLSMPWEICYFKELRLHLGLMPRVIIVRRLLETVRQASPLVAPPFRVVHVIAQPDQYEPITREVQEVERGAIQEAVGREDLYTLVAHPGSVERLLECLRRQPYQIVHFLGHGIVDEDFSQQSYLVFSEQDGKSQLVTGEQFQYLLSATPGIQLIVLNACHGASVVAVNTIAMQLVYNGIPYVIAMQGEVLQKAAAVFAQHLYATVQRGESLEHAVAQARLAIAAEVPGAIDWSLPALYTSLGIAEAPVVERAGGQIERWIGQPEGQRQLGGISIGFGVLHLVVALLLLLSGASPLLPALAPLAQAIGILAVLPPLLAIGACLFGRLPVPAAPAWPLPAQAALLLRMFSATSLGMGLPAVYAWFLLLLLVAFSFWATLAPLAQIVLLVLLFAPGILVSWQEAFGHARGFLSIASITPPTLDLTELIVILAGYIMLCGPLALLWLAPQVIAPPLGNFLAGILLVALGYQLRKQTVAAPARV